MEWNVWWFRPKSTGGWGREGSSGQKGNRMEEKCMSWRNPISRGEVEGTAGEGGLTVATVQALSTGSHSYWKASVASSHCPPQQRLRGFTHSSLDDTRKTTPKYNILWCKTLQDISGSSTLCAGSQELLMIPALSCRTQSDLRLIIISTMIVVTEQSWWHLFAS